MNKLFFSYTQYKMFLKCPMSYYLAYIKGFRKKVVIDCRNFIVGSCVHEAMEQKKKKIYDRSSGLESIFNTYLSKNYVSAVDEDRDILYQRCVVGVAKTEELYSKLGFFDRSEVKFELEANKFPIFDNVLMITRVDIYDGSDGKVYDLKITKDKRFLDDMQLCIYAYGLFQSGYRVSSVAFLTPLLKDPIQERTISRDLIKGALLNVKSMLSELQQKLSKISFGDSLKEVFPIKGYEGQCSHCSYKKVCPHYQVDLTGTKGVI